MAKILTVFKWFITLGDEPQSFLGAGWIPAFLSRVSERKKRPWALRILSLSPHYFLDRDSPEYAGMSNDEYLEATFASLIRSRELIYEKILKPYLDSNHDVLDYGCGPGFLAKATAPHVKQIFAIDISAGAIACAKVVNSAENLHYLVADQDGFSAIPDEQLDAIFSFAVVQHLTNDSFEALLEKCQRKLKPDGRLVLHIQLKDDIWRTEDEHYSNRSIKGKIKYAYGLHCFGRTEQEHIEHVSRFNFTELEINKLEDFVPEFAAEVHSQRLLTARKKSGN